MYESSVREKGRDLKALTIESKTLKFRFAFFFRYNCLRHPYRLLPESFHESPSQWICSSAQGSVRLTDPVSGLRFAKEYSA